MKRIPRQATVFVCLLALVTVQAFASVDPSIRECGFLLLCWALLSGYTLVWLANRYRRFILRVARKGGHDTHLSSQLIYSMHSRQSFDSGVRALKTFNVSFGIICLLFMGYVLWGASMISIHAQMGALTDIDLHIAEFFERYSDGAIQAPAYDGYILEGFLFDAVRLCIAGCLFWTVRILSVSSRIGKFIPWFMFVLFLMMLMVALPSLRLASSVHYHDLPFVGYGWGALDLYATLSLADASHVSAFQVRLFENGICGMIVFITLMFMLFVMILRNFFRASLPLYYTALALFIFSVLVALDVYAVARASHFALYLSGLAVISGLSVQNNLRVRKRHTLYQ